MSRRVVVTGVGLLTSVGIGTEAVWDAIDEVGGKKKIKFNKKASGTKRNIDSVEVKDHSKPKSYKDVEEIENVT